jgi:hypothetical protein
MSMHFRPVSFAADQAIPAVHAKDGGNRSPELKWDSVPASTRSLTVICEDLDTEEYFPHWVLYDIPAGVRRLPEDLPCEGSPELGRQGLNGFGTQGWGGPRPPAGEVHRYAFSILAIDTHLRLPAGASRDDVEEAMDGHVLQEEFFTAIFGSRGMPGRGRPRASASSGPRGRSRA